MQKTPIHKEADIITSLAEQISRSVIILYEESEKAYYKFKPRGSGILFSFENKYYLITVSYTHLTLPTIYSV